MGNKTESLRVICPSCQEEFELDGAQAAKIMAQVRDAAFDRAVTKAVAEKTEAIQEKYQSQVTLERARQREQDLTEFMADKLALEQKIAGLESKLSTGSLQAELAKEQAVRENDAKHQAAEQALRDELEYYRDLKARMSTKMIGETLEQHCAAEFERIRGCLPQGVYFEKDNDARTGSKGDFIYREMDGDTEVLSIMFEMKNEADATEKKHRNEDFFRELDRDRKEKRCEYAVLVSLLESDSEVYNAGIVDVSHRFPNMYVIRPQFFIPLITILRGAALKAVSARKQLEEARNRDLDVSRFEDDLSKFHKEFGYNCEQAGKRLDETVDELDKAIARLQKAREDILAAQRQMRLAGSKAENLTLQRLTRGNRTMQAEFAKAGL